MGRCRPANQLQNASPANPLPPAEPDDSLVTDATHDVMIKNNIAPGGTPVSISQRLIPSSAPDSTLIRIYTTTTGTAPYPVIVYYHGGDWVIGSLDVYEPSCRALCANTGAIVVSVDYRLSPESKFPAAHLDALSAYQWVNNNAPAIGGNASKVAVAGESAGGNMAETVCLMATNANFALPIHQLLIYPVANNDLNTASYQQYGGPEVAPINRPNVVYFTTNYFKSPADGYASLISPVDVADPRGLPPATIIAAQIDVLPTEGKQLADKLNSVGVQTDYTLYASTTHEFFTTWQAVPKAREAHRHAAGRLKAAFGNEAGQAMNATVWAR